MRRSRDLAYVKTPGRREADFLAADFDGHRRLTQVASGISSPAALDRELRVLVEVRTDYPDASLVLLVETDLPRATQAHAAIDVVPIRRWFLQE